MRINGRLTTKERPIIILHGLFGSSDNWQKVAKSLAENYPVFCLDLRNHGESEHSSSMKFSEMADDIIHFVKQMNIDKFHLVGHSLGGKVAMSIADNYPQYLDRLIVVDILPKSYKDSHSQIIEAIKQVDLNVKSKNDINSQLTDKIPELAVRQFIMKNLKRVENAYEWKFNINAIEYNYSKLIAALKLNTIIETKTLFIRGEKSNYITLEEYYEFRDSFVNSELESILGSGHWVHAEEPEAFVKSVLNFIK